MPFPPIQILRAGTFVAEGGQQATITPADLMSLAAGYDPALYQAPLVVGHPQTHDPAYGWVRGLSVVNGVLTAEADRVSLDFSALVEAGAYRKVSASLFPPAHPANPRPGALYLRHVGFLGAAAPAVPGLKPVEFAAAAGLITLDFSLPDDLPPKEAPLSDDHAAREAELKKKEAALDARILSFAAQQKAQQRSADSAFLDGLVASGVPLPGGKEKLLGLFGALSDATPISFAAGESAQSPHQVLRDVLAALPKTVDFSERSSGAGNGGDLPEVERLAREIAGVPLTGKGA